MDSFLTIRHEREQNPDITTPDPHQDSFSKTILGFWMYLMTDCLIFATLFAVYAVLLNGTNGGPGPKELFHLPTAFIETMILLFSSITSGFALLAALKNKTASILGWLAVTLLLGAVFVYIELGEFRHLVAEGHSWTQSAFLSAYFTLVGTHGLHVTIGLLWILVMMAQVFHFGVTTDTFRRLVCFNMFWHFLDLIWIFIFTFVYLIGVM